MIKKCIGKCGKELPATDEYFHRRSSNGKLRNICKECRLERTRKKYFENWEFRQAQIKLYGKIRRQSDIAFKLRDNVSRSIRQLLSKNNSAKNNASILKYLPYTIKELKYHLEKQFEEWMNWDNYGGKANNNARTWWIDHIIPQSLLPYTSMEDENFKKCWSLDNLRPLEKFENIKKGNKIINE